MPSNTCFIRDWFCWKLGNSLSPFYSLQLSREKERDIRTIWRQSLFVHMAKYGRSQRSVHFLATSPGFIHFEVDTFVYYDVICYFHKASVSNIELLSCVFSVVWWDLIVDSPCKHVASPTCPPMKCYITFLFCGLAYNPCKIRVLPCVLWCVMRLVLTGKQHPEFLQK